MKTTKKEALLEAAEVSEKAKEILKKEFPEVFESQMFFDVNKLLPGKRHIFSMESSLEAGFDDDEFFAIRGGGIYKNKAFYLSDDCDWELRRDDWGSLCLVPTRRDEG